MSETTTTTEENTEEVSFCDQLPEANPNVLTCTNKQVMDKMLVHMKGLPYYRSKQILSALDSVVESQSIIN